MKDHTNNIDIYTRSKVVVWVLIVINQSTTNMIITIAVEYGELRTLDLALLIVTTSTGLADGY